MNDIFVETKQNKQYTKYSNIYISSLEVVDIT